MDGTPKFTNNDVKRLRKNIYDARRKVLPENPKNIAEVHATLSNISPKTKQAEPFSLINDEEKQIIIFTCESNLQFLCEISDIYIRIELLNVLLDFLCKCSQFTVSKMVIISH